MMRSEFGERQDDAAAVGQRAARTGSFRAARDDRHARGVAQLQDRDDLRLVFRQSATAAGSSRIQRETVAFVRLRVLRGRQQRRRRQGSPASCGVDGGIEHRSRRRRLQRSVRASGRSSRSFYINRAGATRQQLVQRASLLESAAPAPRRGSSQPSPTRRRHAHSRLHCCALVALRRRRCAVRFRPPRRRR